MWVPRAKRCTQCKKYEDKLVTRALQRLNERYYGDVPAERSSHRRIVDASVAA